MSKRTFVWVTDNIESAYFETLVVSEIEELYIPHEWGKDFTVYWAVDGTEVAFPRRFSKIEDAKSYAEEVASVLYRGEQFDSLIIVPDAFCAHEREGLPCYLGKDHEDWHQHNTETGLRIQWLGRRMKMTRMAQDVK
jgi:hypothetical protein